MRISLFHNLPSGGAKRAVYEWTKRFALRHQIDVYSLSCADHDYCDISPYASSYHIIEFQPQKEHSSPFGRINQFQRWQDLGKLTRIGRQIASEIKVNDSDIVFANACMFSFIPAFLQFIEIPAVYYLHEPLGQRFVRRIERPYATETLWRGLINQIDPFIALYRRRLDSIQRKGIDKTTLLLANSEFTRGVMKESINVDTPVCRYGVDLEGFFPIDDRQKENCVLSVGELTPRKGFDFLIESLSNVSSDIRPALRLACNRIDLLEKNYLEDLADSHQVRLQIISNLNIEQLRREYNAAKLCLYAPVLEPFGLVPLEAMACGTPVIGVKEGGVSESILHEQTGLLVERDPKKFSQAIQHLLSNEGLALEYGRNGRRHVQDNWTWDKSVADLEGYLQAYKKAQ